MVAQHLHVHTVGKKVSTYEMVDLDKEQEGEDSTESNKITDTKKQATTSLSTHRKEDEGLEHFAEGRYKGRVNLNIL